MNAPRGTKTTHQAVLTNGGSHETAGEFQVLLSLSPPAVAKRGEPAALS